MVVSVVGEIDRATAPELERALAKARGGDLIVDLADCTFIDSMGLSVLIRTSEALKSSGHRLLVATDNRTVRRVIETVGLDKELGLESASILELMQNDN